MSHLIPPVNSKDHLQGKDTAVLELVEYGDYQCPYCGRAYPIIKRLQQKFAGELKFIFRNFPLSEIHPHAFNAALAAEAAALQDKFWEMHDIIFEHQRALEAENLFLYAQTIGLDLEQFRNDIQSNSLVEKVETDFESGVRSGVNGTPGFFVNGKKYEGDYEEHVFTQFLKSQLEII